MFNSATAAIFVLDAKVPPVIVECNRAAPEIFGYKKSEMIGKPTAILHVSDESLSKFQSQLYPAIRKDEYFNLEYQMKRKDGSVFPSDHTVTQLLDDHGQRIGWVSVINDISERAKYETRLQALHKHALQLSSAEEIDTIVKYTLDAMEITLRFEHVNFLLVENASLQIKGSRGIPVAFSAQPLEGRGTTVKAATTKTTLRISDTRKEPAFVDPKGYDWTGPPTVLSELVVPVLIDAETVAVLCVDNIHPDAFTDEDQRLLETLATHVASCLKRLNQKEVLRENEERFRKIFAEGPLGIALVRPDYRIARANKIFCAMLGYSEEELTTLKFTDITHPEDIELGVELTEKMRRGEISSFNVEKRYIKKNGAVLSAKLTASFIRDGQGNPTYSVAMIEDITERTRMEKALQESEEKYRAMVENSPNLIGILQDGILKYVNNVAVLNLGWTDKELLSTSFDPIENAVSEESRSVLKENIAKRLRGERMAPYEVTLTKKDGSEVPVLVRAAKIIYNQRPAIEFVFDDITDRKRDEEKLRESEERYHSLFDRMLDGVYRSTHEGRFVDVNPAFVKMFGYSSKEEMLGITDIKKELYFTPQERGSHILDTGQEEVEAYRMRRKDGSEIWVEDHGHYVHDKQGNIIYHEGILRDVTERKRLEEELKQYSLHLEELVAERTGKLQESEEKYRGLFEASPISLWEEDFSAVKQFAGELRQKGVSDFGDYLANHPEDIAKCAALVKVLNMNKATLNLFDAKSVDEIIGGLSHVLSEQSNRAFVGEVVALAQGKRHYEADFENRTLRGETKHCHVICAVVPGYEQSLAKVLISVVDLTPQRKLEAELVKSQRLAAIGETAAMVGHDLRNPLQGIAGATYNIRRRLGNAPDPSTQEMLAVIDNGVQYANEIINDLLEFSREMQLQPLPTTPKSIVRQALTEVRIPNNITIEDTTANTPEILADEPKIKRVLTNLIENAVDAMPAGGKLSISSINTQQEVSVSVRDTGFGVAQDLVEKIWTPLYTTKAKGIGLGLSICRRIIEAHGGTISVESTVGEGTTFTLKLPIQHVQAGGEP